MAITPPQFIDVLRHVGRTIESEKDRFSELDRAIGDGDHGVSLSLGWGAVLTALDELPAETGFAEICMASARSFLNAVGASCGPLYGTAFMRGGMALKDRDEADRDALVAFLEAAGGGIHDRGKAEAGDKTMLDAWLPGIAALTEARDAGGDLDACLTACAEAAEQGMRATEAMQAKKGRAARLGERSVGHIDPGAASSAVFLRAFADGVSKQVG